MKYDAVEQATYSASFCDVTAPLWYVTLITPNIAFAYDGLCFSLVPAFRPRLLGFAGVPLVQSIPCAFLALYAGLRIRYMHKIHNRLWNQVIENNNYDNNFRSIRMGTLTPSDQQSNNYHEESVSPNAPPSLSTLSQPKSLLNSTAFHPPFPSSESGHSYSNTGESREYPAFAVSDSAVHLGPDPLQGNRSETNTSTLNHDIYGFSGKC
jgi:hypothetical protein